MGEAVHFAVSGIGMWCNRPIDDVQNLSSLLSFLMGVGLEQLYLSYWGAFFV